MKRHLAFAALLFGITHLCAQTPVKKPGDIPVGDFCDECDSMYAGIPDFEKISSVATLAPALEPGEKMEMRGRVLNPDRKTPARDVVLYIYHTDANGIYSPAPDQQEARRNGHLRGWVRTNEKGEFSFISVRPAPYPGRSFPAHIHILVKERGKTRYWIDEVWFDDDPLLTPAQRSKAAGRGGNMITHLEKDDRGWHGKLEIILGMKIPNYR